MRHLVPINLNPFTPTSGLNCQVDLLSSDMLVLIHVSHQSRSLHRHDSENLYFQLFPLSFLILTCMSVYCTAAFLLSSTLFAAVRKWEFVQLAD